MRESFVVHHKADLNSDLELVNGKKLICVYDMNVDDPNITDDNYGKTLFISFERLKDLEQDSIYSLPNENIDIKAIKKGAWIGIRKYNSLNGKIRVRIDNESINVLIEDSLKGYFHQGDIKDTISFFGRFEFKEGV